MIPGQRAALCLAVWLCVCAIRPCFAAEDGGPACRVKVSELGEVFLDRTPVTLAELSARLLELKGRGGHIVYYRESPQSEPSRDVMTVLELLTATQIPIQMGHDAPSEWGRLEAFELEVGPQQFRFALARNQPFLFGFRPEGAVQPQVYSGPTTRTEDWFKMVDVLVSSDRVLETPARSPDQAFAPEALAEPSVHIRLIYDQQIGWQAVYPLDNVPSNITSLLKDCSALGLQMIPGSHSQTSDHSRR